MVRSSNHVTVKWFFSTPKRPERHWDPASLLFNGYPFSFTGIKRPGQDVDYLVPRLRRSTAIPLLPLYIFIASQGVLNICFGFFIYFCNGNSSNQNDPAVLPLFHIVPATTEAWSYHGTWFLCAFAKLRKPAINFVMSARLSVCPHGTTRYSVEEFSWTLTFEDFSEICRVCPSINKTWQK